MFGSVAAPKPIWPSPCHTLHHILCLDILPINTTLISAHTCTFGAGKFCDDMTCVLPSISQPNLYQIQLLRGVSESSGPAESKTVIEIQFWARFHGEKRENVRDKWNCGYCIYLKVLYLLTQIMTNNDFWSHLFESGGHFENLNNWDKGDISM